MKWISWLHSKKLQGNCDEAARCYALANAAQSEWPQVWTLLETKNIAIKSQGDLRFRHFKS